MHCCRHPVFSKLLPLTRVFASIMSVHNKNFPSGPLDRYRKRASFDWRQMKSFFYPKDLQEFENALVKYLLENPKIEYSAVPKSLDDQRYLATKRMKAIAQLDILKPENYIVNPEKISRGVHILQTWEPSHVVKLTIAFPMTIGVLQSLGTEKHQDLIEQVLKGEILVCFCLTEVGHGSDVHGMRTTATYDIGSKGFVLNTPDFEAAKCWAGLLGKTATHALVYAQLIVNGTCYGLHTFFVPIRDTKSMVVYPGVTVGDIGEKIGINGVDNGFVMFDQYHIPHGALLNKYANVSEDGTYTTPLRNPKSRTGKSLGALSTGRINITTCCTISLNNSVTIAIRYAAVRKQFSDAKTKEEIPILEYQSLQYRLLPNLAATYALEIFALYITKEHQQFVLNMLMGENSDLTADLGAELHAVSCACKPVSGWLARDAIQECREACGGHGYLKSARLGDIRNFHDANLTFEGDNHVLIQQTSNWLLKFWPMVLNGKIIPASLKSVSFLNKTGDILEGGKFIVDAAEVSNPHNILAAFQWLVCYLLKCTYDKYQTKLQQGLDVFWARNDVQVFYAKNLTTVYIQHYILKVFIEKVKDAPTPEINHVLTQLISLYGLWSLEKHLSTLYKGGYVSGDKAAILMQETILKLCNDIKDDAVSLVDAIAAPDCILNSVLGNSDGLVYKHLQTSFFGNPDAFVRPQWWREVIKQETELVSKL